eukprot:2878401-Alexandrium_andersonii.AAC.1
MCIRDSLSASQKLSGTPGPSRALRSSVGPSAGLCRPLPSSPQLWGANLELPGASSRSKESLQDPGAPAIAIAGSRSAGQVLVGRRRRPP